MKSIHKVTTCFAGTIIRVNRGPQMECSVLGGEDTDAGTDTDTPSTTSTLAETFLTGARCGRGSGGRQRGDGRVQDSMKLLRTVPALKEYGDSRTCRPVAYNAPFHRSWNFKRRFIEGEIPARVQPRGTIGLFVPIFEGKV